MNVAIACEASSFALKEAVKAHIIKLGYSVTDTGQKEACENVLYYQAAVRLVREIQSGKSTRGILMCGTGAGVSMIANKCKGVYCVACESIFTAEKISLINNANVLAMGSRVVSVDIACEMAEKFLVGKWCDGFAEQRKRNNEKGYEVLRAIERNISLEEMEKLLQ